MSSKNPLEGMVRFAESEPWTGVLAALLIKHTAAACTEMNTAPDMLPQVLDQGVYAMMFTCVVEDLMTQTNGTDGQSITDAFMKRHGWKLGSTAKRQVQAIRDSAMGLYEIIGVRPGVGLELRDILQPDYEAEVRHAGLAETLPVGCLIGARLLRNEGVIEFSGGMLPFEEGLLAEAVTALRASADLGDGPPEESQRKTMAPHITNFWLKKTLQEALHSAQG